MPVGPEPEGEPQVAPTRDVEVQSDSLLLSDYVALELQLHMAEATIAQGDRDIQELQQRLAGFRRLHGNQADTIASLKEELEGMRRIHHSQAQHIEALRRFRILPDEIYICPARDTCARSSDTCGHVQAHQTRRISPCRDCVWPTAADVA